LLLDPVSEAEILLCGLENLQYSFDNAGAASRVKDENGEL
jgi:hypothetical protein